jgi:hypothetical protein
MAKASIDYSRGTSSKASRAVTKAAIGFLIAAAFFTVAWRLANKPRAFPALTAPDQIVAPAAAIQFYRHEVSPFFDDLTIAMRGRSIIRSMF